ncbi:MAG: RNA polymerase sigma factor [Nannocystaceae bacterium]
MAEHLDAAELFRRHATFVASFLVRLGANRNHVDDLVQDVFLVAHRRGGFELGPARPTTWLAQIALRVFSGHRRRRRRRPEQPDTNRVTAELASSNDPGQQAQTQQALERVQQALEQLDENKRAIFILYELQGESCEAIAAGLGIPVGTVYSRLHHARKRFRQAHQKLLGATAPTREQRRAG